MRTLLGGILLMAGFTCSQCTAQEAADIAGRLERAGLLADAVKDQLEELKSGAELSGLERALILLESLKDELPQMDVSDGQTLRDRSADPGFRSLYTASRDGSDIQFLTVAPGMIGSASPVWSASGRMLAFDAHPKLGHFQLSHIFVYAINGPFKGGIKDLGCGNVPTWSPDESQIAFMLISGNPDGVEEGIWVMNSDGSDRRRLCDGWYPSWSPDGKSICVQSMTDDPQCPQIYDVATGETRKILGDKWAVSYSGATWSPDGSRLIFVGQYEGHQHLATVDVSGDEDTVRVLYKEEDPQRRFHGPPAWSPDGQEAIISIQDSGVRGRHWMDTWLYRIAVDDPQEPQLFESSKEGVINRGMAWSPDGRRLAFSSER